MESKPILLVKQLYSNHSPSLHKLSLDKDLNPNHSTNLPLLDQYVVEMKEFDLCSSSAWEDIRDWCFGDNSEIEIANPYSNQNMLNKSNRFNEIDDSVKDPLKEEKYYSIEHNNTISIPELSFFETNLTDRSVNLTQEYKITDLQGGNVYFIRGKKISSENIIHNNLKNALVPEKLKRNLLSLDTKRIIDSLKNISSTSSNKEKKKLDFSKRYVQKFPKRSLTEEERNILTRLTNFDDKNQDFYFELANFNFNETILMIFEESLSDYMTETLPTQGMLNSFKEREPYSSASPYIEPVFYKYDTIDVFSSHLILAAYKNEIERFKAIYEYIDLSGISPPLVKNIKFKDSFERNVLHFVNSIELASYILDKDPDLFDMLDSEKLSPLAHAIYKNLPEVTRFYLKRIIEKPTLPIEKYSTTYTLFSIAIYQSSPELIKIMYESKLFDPKVKDKTNNTTPLFLASIFMKNDICETIIKLWGKDSGINTPVWDSGLTPLIAAITSKNNTLAIFLIENGADLNYYDFEDNSIFFHIFKWKNEEIGVELIKRGYKPFLYKNIEISSLTIRYKLGFHLIADEIDKRDNIYEKRISDNTNEDPFKRFCNSILYEDIQNVKELCQNNRDFVTNIQKFTFQSPLHIACSTGNEKIVKILIDNGADISIKNALGFTVSHISNLFNHSHLLPLFNQKPSIKDYSKTSIKNTHSLSANRWLINPITLRDKKFEYFLEKHSYITTIDDSLIQRITQLYTHLPKYKSLTCNIECCSTFSGINIGFNQLESVYLYDPNINMLSLYDYFRTKDFDKFQLDTIDQLKIDILTKIAFLLTILHKSNISHGSISPTTIKIIEIDQYNIEVLLHGYELQTDKMQDDLKSFGEIAFPLLFIQEWKNRHNTKVKSTLVESYELIYEIMDGTISYESVLTKLYSIRKQQWNSIIDKLLELKNHHPNNLQVEMYIKNAVLLQESAIKEEKTNFEYLKKLTYNQFTPYYFNSWIADTEKVISTIEKKVSITNEEKATLKNTINFIKYPMTSVLDRNDTCNIISKLLSIKEEDRTLALDILRGLFSNGETLQYFVSEKSELIESILISLKNVKNPSYITFGIRLICNIFSEVDGINWILLHRDLIYDIITVCISEEKPTSKLALAALICNMSYILPSNCEQLLNKFQILIWEQIIITIKNPKKFESTINDQLLERFLTSFLFILKKTTNYSFPNSFEVLDSIHKLFPSLSQSANAIAIYLFESNHMYWDNH